MSQQLLNFSHGPAFLPGTLFERRTRADQTSRHVSLPQLKTVRAASRQGRLKVQRDSSVSP
jgi:hypothetical protein